MAFFGGGRELITSTTGPKSIARKESVDSGALFYNDDWDRDLYVDVRRSQNHQRNHREQKESAAIVVFSDSEWVGCE
jgi:hypothetical protein